MATREEVLGIVPQVKKARRGYMAVSGAEHPLVIAVFGPTEEEARRNFARRLRSWATYGDRQGSHEPAVRDQPPNQGAPGRV